MSAQCNAMSYATLAQHDATRIGTVHGCYATAHTEHTCTNNIRI